MTSRSAARSTPNISNSSSHTRGRSNAMTTRICKAWADDPRRFISNPQHQSGDQTSEYRSETSVSIAGADKGNSVQYAAKQIRYLNGRVSLNPTFLSIWRTRPPISEQAAIASLCWRQFQGSSSSSYRIGWLD